MQLITLNIWGGHVHDPLLKFIEANKSVDIFCFQEVYKNAAYKTSTDDRFVSLDIFSEIQNILSDHNGFFEPIIDNIYGICAFINKNIDVVKYGKISIHENPEYTGVGPTHSRILQWLECTKNNQSFTVMNVHGLWNGQGKTDTPERMKQSHKIRNFLDSVNMSKILCGDFNLRPDTKSLQLIEPNLRNLVKEYNITSTRTSFYTKDEKFADYIFTSPEIKVNHFEVLISEVSDHAALLLDFN